MIKLTSCALDIEVEAFAQRIVWFGANTGNASYYWRATDDSAYSLASHILPGCTWWSLIADEVVGDCNIILLSQGAQQY